MLLAGDQDEVELVITMQPAGDQDEVELVIPQPGHQQAASSVHYTTSCKHGPSAPEDGRNYRPKHVELIEINNYFYCCI